MAWFQNLADRAEVLLNKIDQNAATVLNESGTATLLEESEHVDIAEPSTIHYDLTQANITIIDERHDTLKKTNTAPNLQDHAEILEFKASPTKSASEKDFKMYDQPVVAPQLSSKASSYNLFEEQLRYEEQIGKLEVENQELNKQILNLQQLLSELRNEHSNLEVMVTRANESAQQAQSEMEQYKVRAHRVLQEKDKLIQVKKESSGNDGELQILTTYNEELKKELEFQQDRNKELELKMANSSKELAMLQQQYMITQNSNRQSNQLLQETLQNERKIRASAEEEIQQKTKELQTVKMELVSLQDLINAKDAEIVDLRKTEHVPRRSSDDVEVRIQVLTQTLMHKQETLEKTTAERNALRIQLEKLEVSYNQLLNQRQRTFVVGTNDTDDAKSQVPRLLQPSPLDAGVTRRVKHAYSTLDMFSIRSGTFLRRYPVARVFVFCYMILLHFWALIILLIYVPR